MRRALNTHHVVFFRDQELTPAEQADFARQFGEVTEGHPVIPAIDEHREVLAIDSREDRANWWHTDVTFLQTPAFGSILYMITVPEVGGDTCWASLQDAYDRLAEPVRAMCDTLVAIHHDPWFAADVDAKGLRLARRGIREAAARRPSRRTHPPGERPHGLFVNPHFTQTILGLSKNEIDGDPRHALPPLPTARAHLSLPLAPGVGRLLGQPRHPPLRDRRLRRCHPVGHRVTLQGDVPYGPAKPPA